MEVKEEEKREKGEKKETAEQSGGIFGGHDSPSAQPPEKGGGEALQQYPGTKYGTCERCGRESDVLYSVHGLSICPSCYFSGGASAAPPSFFAQIVTTLKRAAGIREKPRILEQQPQMVFSIKDRRMVEKKPEAHAKKEQPAPDDTEPAPSSPHPPAIFNVHDRKLVEKKEGISAEQPISEGAREEKKPSPKAKKTFFKMHPASGGMAKKK